MLNLNDNKRPYFKQLNLDETFDEIQDAVNGINGPDYFGKAVLITFDSEESGLIKTTLQNTIKNTDGTSLIINFTRISNGVYKFSYVGLPDSQIAIVTSINSNNLVTVTNATWDSSSTINIYTLDGVAVSGGATVTIEVFTNK